MSDDNISFQTWICPVCCDDHLKENFKVCRDNLKSDYDKLKAERDELKAKLDIAVEALETITEQYTDMADGDIRDMWAKQAIEALNKIKNDNP